MIDARQLSPLYPDEHERFLRVIQASLGVRRHFDLFCWLQGDLQFFLPHDILLAAWGDPNFGLLYVDVISPLPGMRTGPVIDRDITPFVQSLFGQWKDSEYAPFILNVPEGFTVGGGVDQCSISRTFLNMRSATVHGIKDRRGQSDCLYAFFSSYERVPASAAKYMEMLLPHVDTALRQVTHLPEQLKKPRKAQPADDGMLQAYGLSKREIEIMKWVRSGKTNQEIGMILNISAFTVKNHLQRIFRKLNVTNRAQAVAQFSGEAKQTGRYAGQ